MYKQFRKYISRIETRAYKYEQKSLMYKKKINNLSVKRYPNISSICIEK